MKARIRAWLDETHGASFELVRHFLASIFDSDMFSVPGEWQKVAAGLMAVLLSLGILALPTFMQSFNMMGEAGLSPLRIYGEMRAYELTFVTLAIGITALLTALAWQSYRMTCMAGNRCSDHLDLRDVAAKSRMSPNLPQIGRKCAEKRICLSSYGKVKQPMGRCGNARGLRGSARRTVSGEAALTN